jgi:hypothetical protein
MKKYAPIATLVAVVLLGGALMVANMITTPRAAKTAAPPAPVSAPSAAPAPEPSAAPPATEEAAPAVTQEAYTGRSAGNEVTVAVAVKNGKAVAYVCDGKKVEAWMEGSVAGGKLSLTGKTGTIAGTVDDKATFGTIAVDGKEWPFSAKGVQAPAGLYEGRGTLRGVEARVGWIVEENGTVTGVKTVQSQKDTAPPLGRPAAGTRAVDGGTLTVIEVAGDTTVVQP